MTKGTVRGLLLTTALLSTACSNNEACEAAKDNLPKCGFAYLGDDNCELLTEDCDDDDLIVLEAFYKCIGSSCADPSLCEVHLYRLSNDCLDSLDG